MSKRADVVEDAMAAINARWGWEDGDEWHDLDPKVLRETVEGIVDPLLGDLGEATKARDYLDREVRRMRQVLQDMGAWDEFCRAYGDRYPVHPGEAGS